MNTEIDIAEDRILLDVMLHDKNLRNIARRTRIIDWEDVLQNFYLKIYSKFNIGYPDTVADNNELGKWLSVCFNNFIIDHYRGQKRQKVMHVKTAAAYGGTIERMLCGQEDFYYLTSKSNDPNSIKNSVHVESVVNKGIDSEEPYIEMNEHQAAEYIKNTYSEEIFNYYISLSFEEMRMFFLYYALGMHLQGIRKKVDFKMSILKKKINLFKRELKSLM
jgi:DNA-directed RNA polymerase specialized sigma24 family protein